MGKEALIGRSTHWISGVAFALALGGCGSAEDKSPDSRGGRSGASGESPGEAGSTEEGGTAGVSGAAAGGRSGRGGGGSTAMGGSKAIGGGSPLVAGRSSGGSPSAGMPGVGGTSSCVNGAPCNCKKLAGTVECVDGEATCVCPPAAECQPEAGEPCFEPCGGEPFGAWVLEDTCFAAGAFTEKGCEGTASGTAGESDLRLRILDGGGLEVHGTEAWAVNLTLPLACLGLSTTASCSFYQYTSNPLLFAYAPSSSCSPNACGACDCENTVQTAAVNSFQYANWHRDDATLYFGNTSSAPYCVQDDVLWVGGGDAAGPPKVAYKFRKQSCVGAPVPCSERTVAQCDLGDSCSLGACTATATGNALRCSAASTPAACGVLQGCSWDPEACAGEVSGSCNFETCESEPGCMFGDPVEKCGGEPIACESRGEEACSGTGCAWAICQPNAAEEADCALLARAADCTKAPGCVVAPTGSATPCTGETLCTAQTSEALCTQLECIASQGCVGTPTACSELTLATCATVPGCRREW